MEAAQPARRSYDWPKNATRRRATTPRISKSENATSANGVEQDSLLGLRDEVLAIVEAWRQIVTRRDVATRP